MTKCHENLVNPYLNTLAQKTFGWNNFHKQMWNITPNWIKQTWPTSWIEVEMPTNHDIGPSFHYTNLQSMYKTYVLCYFTKQTPK
jgi:hypothetical protein